MIAQFSCHLMDNFLENHRVNVLAQHVQQEKVPHLGLLDDYVDALLLDQPEPDVQKVGPYSWREDNEDSVNHNQEGQNAKKKKPEPNEDVDFLINYIYWQYTHGIMLLNFPTGTKLVKCTFGHPGENINHWINSIFLVSFCK